EVLVALVKQSGLGKLVKLRVLDGKGRVRLVSIKLEPRPDLPTLQRSSLVGRPAPDFLPSVQAGAKVGKISTPKGQVVLLDFFATWCGPCIEAMPHLEELHQRFGQKGLTVIGVSTESASIVAAAAARFHLKYSLAADETESVSQSYRVFALPTLV